MKRLVLLTLIILGVSSLAFGQAIPGSIGIFVDQAGTDCNILDAGPPGPYAFYIVHVGTNGAFASRFKLDALPATLTYLGESSPFGTTIGSVLTGISIAYQACYSGSFHIVTVNFFGVGATPACVSMTIVPDPASETGNVEIVDCDQNINELTVGGEAIINTDGTCDCLVDPTKDTSWGAIKSLYK